MQSSPYAVYIHVPFCREKCTYCIFNTYVNLDHLIPAYVDALVKELRWVGSAAPKAEVHTVYFGGGTPSLLSPDQLERILAAIAGVFMLRADAEISLEANPASVEMSTLAGFRSVGVNRLSLGAQSVHQSELRLFNRAHMWEHVVQAVAFARHAGFDNLNLDFIYGIPGQTLAMWQETLDQGIALGPEHFALYSLTIDPGSALHHWMEARRFAYPDSDLAADMYELATGMLANAGYAQYEISNWAQPGRACIHNIQYWRNEPYLAFGPGAHGYANGIRYQVVDSPWAYIQRLQTANPSQVEHSQVEQVEKYGFPVSPAVIAESVEHVDEAQARADTMMLQLRLLGEGVSRSQFEKKFGMPVEYFYNDVIDQLSEWGFLSVTPDHICLTSKARLLGNRIFGYFV